MKKLVMIVLLITVAAVIATGCATFNAEVHGPLPRANEVYIGEVTVIHDGKPADAEYAQNIISAYKETLAKELADYSFKVVDKSSINSLILKTAIKDDFYFMVGFGTGGLASAAVDVYYNNSLLIVLNSSNISTSKLVGGTSAIAKRWFAPLLAKKIKEHFNPD